jgi:hypothetical protein
MDLFFFLI